MSSLKLNERQVATLLAALRYWQNDLDDNSKMGEDGFAPHFENVAPLTSKEIDELCEHINLAGDAPPPTPDCSDICDEVIERLGDLDLFSINDESEFIDHAAMLKTLESVEFVVASRWPRLLPDNHWIIVAQSPQSVQVAISPHGPDMLTPAEKLKIGKQLLNDDKPDDTTWSDFIDGCMFHGVQAKYVFELPAQKKKLRKGDKHHH